MRLVRSSLAAAAVRGLVAALALWARPVLADQLDAEVHDDESGFNPIEELSYEVFVEASREASYDATVRVRVALHNGSGSERDAVDTLALPASAELVGIAIARDGVWHDGAITDVADDGVRREPGTAWVRTFEPDRPGGLRAAEISVFGIPSESTVQVELRLRVFPTLRFGRWELELPSRGRELRSLANDRRVLVRGLPAGQGFWVDDASSGGEPVMTSAPDESVMVAWPARTDEKGTLLGRLDVSPGPAGFDDGRFRMVVRLGDSPTRTPDHVTFVFDRSRSTPARMHSDAQRLIERVLDGMPAGATFDAIAFARTAVPLVGDKLARARDASARATLARALDDNAREQGTDLATALDLAAQRIRKDQGSKRPMIVVITDGMLPASLGAGELRKRFDAAIGDGPRPELLFVVDEPMLERSGLPATHPVAVVAATLGARISLESLARLSETAAARVLAAPRVLGDLAVELPGNVVLDAPLPSGLVAGSVLVVRGRYVGKAPKEATVRGRLGEREITHKLKAHAAPGEAEAWVASLGVALGDLTDDGFARPPWHRLRQQRAALAGIAQSGRGRELRGYLDEKIFRTYLTQRVLPRARVCYNRALVQRPEQDGRIVLEFEVGKGEVMLARARVDRLTWDDKTMMDCMSNAAWALDVPAGKLDDTIYVVRYPLRLVKPAHPGDTGRIERGRDDPLEVLPGPSLGR